MKDQLQLQEIAGYLPYRLTMYAPHGFRPNYKESTGTHRVVYLTGDLYADLENNTYQGAEFKPILRPISDLTKEITHNGKKIILAKALWSVSAEDEEDFDMYGHIPEYWSLCIHHIENNLSRTEYGDVLAMYEYHFDIHNLIERGLAININNLPPIKD